MRVQLTKVSTAWIPLALATFGLGTILGNMAGGWLFDKLQFKAVAWLLVWSALVLVLFPVAALSPWTVLPAVFAVGTMVALGAGLGLLNLIESVFDIAKPVWDDLPPGFPDKVDLSGLTSEEVGKFTAIQTF